MWYSFINMMWRYIILARDYTVYYKGMPYATISALAKAKGISVTALNNNSTLTEDREVVLREGLSDLSDVKRVMKPKAGIDFKTFRYGDRKFSDYRELSSYVGIPLVAIRNRNFTDESFVEYVEEYRKKEYPVVVNGDRYPSLLSLALAYDLPKGTFSGMKPTDPDIEERLREAIESKNARESFNEPTVLYKGEYYENLAEISMKFNLDIRELLTAQRCGEPLESVTKVGRWGVLTENGLDLTPRRFYEYQAERANEGNDGDQ